MASGTTGLENAGVESIAALRILSCCQSVRLFVFTVASWLGAKGAIALPLNFRPLSKMFRLKCKIWG